MVYILPTCFSAKFLPEIFAQEYLLPLHDICKKVNNEAIENCDDATFCLLQFLVHNDRDFQDCCYIFNVCKFLSTKDIIPEDEKNGLKCIKQVLNYIFINKENIISLYKKEFNEDDVNFLKNLDVIFFIKKLNKMEEKIFL